MPNSINSTPISLIEEVSRAQQPMFQKVHERLANLEGKLETLGNVKDEAHRSILNAVKSMWEELKGDLDEIKAQTTKTNGRVTVLEEWRITEKAKEVAEEKFEGRNTKTRENIIYKVITPIITGVSTAVIMAIIFFLSNR